jgi:hypothetical protein
MTRLFVCLSLFATIGTVDLSMTSARAADAWGCSYEKCLAYCSKVGGQRCSTYCTNKLREKQLAKTCPAS